MSSATIICLHFLGGSARTWDKVAEQLAPGITCRALDLPGFGSAADKPGASVSEMAESVAASIRALQPRRWWIIGHSMGAKVALAIARRAENGTGYLAGLSGIILLAGSPPAPEPMDEEKRSDMISWIDQSDDVRQAKARTYIAENVGSPLSKAVERNAINDVLAANPTAWKRWLAEGAGEDWREAIGVLRTPSLVVSGSEDRQLGPEAQARLTAPHLAKHQTIVVDGAGHLLPLERPGAVAALLNQAIQPR